MKIFIWKRKNLYNPLIGLLYEFIGLASAMILTLFFCKVIYVLLLDDLPPTIIPYLIAE
jgi:hypothetical protein